MVNNPLTPRCPIRYREPLDPGPSALAINPAPYTLAIDPPIHELTSARGLGAVDGDTLRVASMGTTLTIRLLGMDAPELDDMDPDLARLARLARWLLHGLTYGEDLAWQIATPPFAPDPYDRTLAFVHRLPDGLDVGAELLRQGLARTTPQWPCNRALAYTRLETRARILRRGLYAPRHTVYPSPPPSE